MRNVSTRRIGLEVQPRLHKTIVARRLRNRQPEYSHGVDRI